MTTADTAASPRLYLHSINFFRGIAILIIVAGHSWGLAGWKLDSVPEKVFGNLVAGGTSLFVFISGFLFYHVYYHSFSYRRFLLNKIRNVLSPYMILSAAAFCYFVYYRQAPPLASLHFSGAPGIWHETVRPFLLYLWTGALFPPYWFMPFIMLTFLMAPFHIRFVGWRPSRQLVLIGVLLLVSVFMHRPCNRFMIPQAVVYFLPVYLTGIFCSLHPDRVYVLLQNREPLFLAGALGLALVHVMICGNHDNPVKNPFCFHGPDLMILQKTLLCLFFMVWLHRFEHRGFRVLRWLASASFAIFFIHPWVLPLYGPIGEAWWIPMPVPVKWIYKVLVVVLISLAAALVIKILFRRKSRMVIGW